MDAKNPLCNDSLLCLFRRCLRLSQVTISLVVYTMYRERHIVFTFTLSPNKPLTLVGIYFFPTRCCPHCLRKKKLHRTEENVCANFISSKPFRTRCTLNNTVLYLPYLYSHAARCLYRNNDAHGNLKRCRFTNV